MTADSATIFVHDSQIDETVREHLGPSVKIQPYESFFPYLTELSSNLENTSKPVSLGRFSWYTRLTATSQTKRILISKQASLAIAGAIGKVIPLPIPYRLVHDRESQDFVEIEQSIVANLKSIKNKVEVSGFRKSHVRDGVALVRYFAWLEEQLKNGAVLSESQGADQLEKYRA